VEGVGLVPSGIDHWCDPAFIGQAGGTNCGTGCCAAFFTEVFYRDPTWCAGMLEKIPAGRFGALDDLIGATVFLCSEAARYVTGQLLLHRRRLHGVDLTRARVSRPSSKSGTEAAR
jgi:hypothetical protein